MNKTFAILTLGCKVNFYESESLKEKLLGLGYLEKDYKEATFIFVNTCAVTNQAERQDLQKVRSVARDNPLAKFIVLGCSSQIHKEKYLAIKQVIKVFGTDIKCRSVELLDSPKSDFINTDSRHFQYEDSEIKSSEYPVRAYLKVQDGCNNYCSYCVIPFTRGNSRFRDKDSIIREAKELISNGYHELIIGGIDTGSYHDPKDISYNLTSLLKDLIKISPLPYRIRVSSIEISQIDDSYINLFKDNPQKLCPHFHIPLQSGSERILKLMNRKYSKEEYLSKVNEIQSALPNVALSTDIITGFPTETESDFRDTYDFAKKIGFMRIHAFPYSERPFTMASKLNGKVAMEIRRERVKKLLKLSEENKQKYLDSLKGQVLSILIEHRGKNNTYSGYSENYLEINVKSTKDIFNSFISYKVD
jgi:threonylcarbamoyladenosine tRNA methylthiotransferase MtaB